MDTKHIISLTYQEPDLLDIFGETTDQVGQWRLETEVRINDLMIRASREVSQRKATTQSGF